MKWPDGLPPSFSHAQARAAGISDRRLYALRDAGSLEQLGRGLFQRTDTGADTDPDLVEIALRAPTATLCLITALARHDLTDEIPSRIDVALPRGRRHPTTSLPTRWHSFAPETFDVGRTTFPLSAELSMGLYGPERCIIDAFRMRHQEGPETAIEALRRWLRRRGSHPATLLTMARGFPKAEPALRHALEVLL